MIVNGEYYLVTVDMYFVAPDGEEYRSVWGKCTMVEAKDAFGFTPQRPSTNWFLQVGEGDNSCIIAGCQIHCAVRCKKPPVKRSEVYDHDTMKIPVVANKIYFTQ